MILSLTHSCASKRSLDRHRVTDRFLRSRIHDFEGITIVFHRNLTALYFTSVFVTANQL